MRRVQTTQTRRVLFPPKRKNPVAWKDNQVVSQPVQRIPPLYGEHRRMGHLFVSCPRSLALYNKFMGGVDHSNQLRGSYSFRLKCTKNYKYIFVYFFDVAITNPYILHTNFDVHSEVTTDHKTFRIVLTEQTNRLVHNALVDR